MPVTCTEENCNGKAVLKRPKTGDKLCKECFYSVFEEEIHQTIITNSLFVKGDTVAIGASGGKDSTVLAYIMKTLNDRYNYGLNLILLSIDEGITGYRDDSLEKMCEDGHRGDKTCEESLETEHQCLSSTTVKRNKIQYDMPLKILSYEELYGWTMDDIVKHVGRKNNCTFCGVFRRQALDRGAMIVGANKIVTGHNADDIAETVLMNIYHLTPGVHEKVVAILQDDTDQQIGNMLLNESASISTYWASDNACPVVLRGDIARLQRCTAITTGSDGGLPRCKPFKYTYEKEIVMYAYFEKLDYFSTECIYSPNAYRGYARTFLKDLEKIRPSCIIDIIHSGECMSIKKDVKMPTQGTCTKCGYISSQALCKACVMLEGLNRGLPKLGIGKVHRGKGKAILDSVIQESLSNQSSMISLYSSNTSLSSAASTNDSSLSNQKSSSLNSTNGNMDKKSQSNCSNCSCANNCSDPVAKKLDGISIDF